MQFQHVYLRGSDGKPDVIEVPDILADYMDRNPSWERIVSEPQPEKPKGAGHNKQKEQ